MEPSDPTMVFSPSDTFHAVATIQNAPDGTKFQAEWFAEDVGSAAEPNTRIDGTELVAGEPQPGFLFEAGGELAVREVPGRNFGGRASGANRSLYG